MAETCISPYFDETLHVRASNQRRECMKLFPKGSQLVVYDCNFHGKSDKDESCLDLDSLSQDFKILIETLYPDPKDISRCLLIGHSLGGAVVAHLAHGKLLSKNPFGIALIDVVEGTALESLHYLKTFLSSRPASFPSISAAIDWVIHARLIRNRESASLSVPYLLQKNAANGSYEWMTDFAATEPFWQGWFHGLDQKFLHAPTNKLLVLADTNRLDRELMIGHMQGKFQLEIMSEELTGHAIEEDAPKPLAHLLFHFWQRFSRPIVTHKMANAK